MTRHERELEEIIERTTDLVFTRIGIGMRAAYRLGRKHEAEDVEARRKRAADADMPPANSPPAATRADGLIEEGGQ
jgi:hypothetical protein